MSGIMELNVADDILRQQRTSERALKIDHVSKYFGGPSRLIFHGIDRLLPGTSSLLPEDGRINLTLRRVTKAGRGAD